MSTLVGAKVKVSSVLNKDTKQFGKQFLTDSNHETCWNSSQGTNQFIQIEFPAKTLLNKLQIMFQGGFAGKNCAILVYENDKFEKVQGFYPKDDNSMQEFELGQEAEKIRILFEDSTDFYGRVTVYHLDIV